MVADRHVGQNPVRFQLLPLVVLAAGEDLWLEGQYAAVWTPLALQELLVLVGSVERTKFLPRVEHDQVTDLAFECLFGVEPTLHCLRLLLAHHHNSVFVEVNRADVLAHYLVPVQPHFQLILVLLDPEIRPVFCWRALRYERPVLLTLVYHCLARSRSSAINFHLHGGVHQRLSLYCPFVLLGHEHQTGVPTAHYAATCLPFVLRYLPVSIGHHVDPPLVRLNCLFSFT